MSVNTDTILDFLKKAVESKRPIPADVWGDAGFKLNLLLGDEHIDLENYRALVASERLAIYKAQEKKNVAATDIEIEASENYRQMRLQEHRVDRIEEFIKLAKKNMSQY
jgi:hypothetical protein